MWGGKQHTSFTRSHAQACLRVREVGALRVTYLQAVHGRQQPQGLLKVVAEPS